MISWLPHINVALNSIATILLIVGFSLIKKKQETAHRNVMIAALSVSAVFLVSYLTYHFNIEGGSKKFPTDTDVAPLAARYFYYVMLASHIILAMTVPFLALGSVYLGLKGKREAHKRLSKWTWPIWLYVSITGVLVYLMLYQIYLPTSE